MTNIERYDYAFDPDGDEWAAKILRSVPSNSSVLELGPGPGAMTRVLRDRGHQVVAVEQDSEALTQLVGMGVEVIQENLDQSAWLSSLGARHFDTILACDVLEHLRSPEVVLEALASRVSEHGRLIVSVPNIAYAGVVAGLRNGVFDYTDKGQLDRTHVHFFTRRSFETVLLNCGWIPISWQANRVPIESSEFAWNWNAISPSLKKEMLSGWSEFDVYQWMVVAVPSTDKGWQNSMSCELKEARDETESLRRKLAQLESVYKNEHESLLEHQKAFSEAKSIIEDLQVEVKNGRSFFGSMIKPNDEKNGEEGVLEENAEKIEGSTKADCENHINNSINQTVRLSPQKKWYQWWRR